jgi:hypothetical protein
MALSSIGASLALTNARRAILPARLGPMRRPEIQAQQAQEGGRCLQGSGSIDAVELCGMKAERIGSESAKVLKIGVASVYRALDSA